MSRPDNLLIGMLVAKEVLTYEEAEALTEAYSVRNFHNPVPYDLDCGVDKAVDILNQIDDAVATEEVAGGGECEKEELTESDWNTVISTMLDVYESEFRKRALRACGR